MFAAQGHQKHLSFAWLVADVLAKVRLTRLLEPNVDANISKFSFDLLGDRLTEHILAFATHNAANVTKLKSGLRKANYVADKSAEKAQRLIYDFCQCHDGLVELLCFVYRWAKKYGLIVTHKTGSSSDTAESKRPKRVDIKQPDALERLLKNEEPVKYDLVQLLLTFIQFGHGEFFGTTRASSSFLETPSNVTAKGDRVNLYDQRGGLGRKFAMFLEFLASLAFATISEHSFAALGYDKTFKNGEWRRLHKVICARALCVTCGGCNLSAAFRPPSQHTINSASTTISPVCLATMANLWLRAQSASLCDDRWSMLSRLCSSCRSTIYTSTLGEHRMRVLLDTTECDDLSLRALPARSGGKWPPLAACSVEG